MGKGNPLDGVYPTPDRHPRPLIWDVETTGLKADFGRMLCFSYQWHGDKEVHLETIRHTKAFKRGHFWDDGELIRKLHTVLMQADSLIHHFGDRFDLKFFKTRLLDLGLYFPNIHTVDTWKIAKKHLLLQSNRMGNIADFLGGEQKSSVPKQVWIQAGMGHAPSIRKLETYCKQDVKTLAGVYEKLKPYCNVINHNLFYNIEGCPKCGSKDFHKEGSRFTANGRVQRFQCRSCASWFDGKHVATAKLKGQP